ncbi:MAG: twin-arginine translocase subunit TatB [Ardenticatenia bacterium]|nr:MAG: twin-arginine translocase subunit TatB [Ardenticatenia bacterium]
MEIFNIGVGEMIVIAIIGLLVFGPERLPEVMRQVAKVTKQIQALSSEFNKALQESLQEVESPVNETREIVKRNLEEARATITETEQHIKNTENELAGELASILGTDLMETPPATSPDETPPPTETPETHDHETTR